MVSATLHDNSLIDLQRGTAIKIKFEDRYLFDSLIGCHICKSKVIDMINYIYEQTNDILTKFKNKTAVFYAGEEISTLTYENVAEISDTIHAQINLSKNVCVGLYMQHNPYIPSLIHCLQRCGCSFVFLDETNTSLIKRLNIKYVLAYKSRNLEGAKVSTTINLDTKHTIQVYEFAVESETSHPNINYIVQTSGTTDEQKIVKVEHHCIAANITSLKKKFHIDENDTIYYGTRLMFDPSMVELYLALTTGAALFVVSTEIQSDPRLLHDTLFKKFDSKVTVMQTCPSLFLLWNESEVTHILRESSLRVLALGGEEFPERIAQCEKSDDLRIFNLYGITEVSSWATAGEVIRDEEISLGEALDDTMLEVRDPTGVRIDEGLGELYIGSNKRICYVGDEKVSEVKKPLLRATGDIIRVENNKFFYVSRCNHVIKRYGHRVNLKRVESITFEFTGIESKCLWLQDRKKLILFVKIHSTEISREKIVDKLRVKLLHSLSKECYPDLIEIIETFPLTRNGKIDTKELERVARESQLRCNDGDLLNGFKLLWWEYFKIDDENYLSDRNFYDLGGNSILRLQAASRLKAICGEELPTNFFDYVFTNTFREICDFIKSLNSNERKHSSYFPGTFDVKMKVKWTYDLQACVDSTATILKNKGLIAVGSFSNIFVILNAANGKLISQKILPNAIESKCCLSPSENVAYLCCYDGNLYCLDVFTCDTIWVYATSDKIKNTPSLISRHNAIVFGSYDKHVHCVNCESGLSMWKTNVGESITSDTIYSELAKCICVASIHGTAFCLSETSGHVIWKLKIGCPIFGSPCFLNGHVIWPDVLGTIHAVNLQGEEVWSYKCSGLIYSSLLSYENRVIFGSHDNFVYCIRRVDDRTNLEFKTALDSPISSSVAVLNGAVTYLVAVSSSGFVYLINFEDGSISSSFKLGGQIFSSPVVKDSEIFVGCRDNNLYCVEFA